MPPPEKGYKNKVSILVAYLLLLPIALTSPLLFGVENSITATVPNTTENLSPPTVIPSPPEDSKPVSPTSRLVLDFLGPQIIDILSKPDRVESFQLLAETTDETLPAKNQLAGYPILKVGPLLTASQIQTVQTLVFSEASYLFDISNRCPFRPDTGLRFIKADQEVDLLWSFACELWKVVYQGHAKTEDFNATIRPQLQQLRAAWFP